MTRTIASEIRRLREEKRWRPTDLAAYAKVSRSLVSEVEAGKKPPGDEALRKIAAALGANYDELAALADADRLGPEGLARLQATIPGLTTAAQIGVSVEPTQEGPRPIGHKGFVPLPAWRISCGDLMQLENTPDALESWPAEIAAGTDAVMTVVGTSMLGCGFSPGDKLLVKMLRGARPQPGDEVIAKVGDGYTCKVYRKDKLGAYLEAAPGEGEPWRLPIGPDVQLVAVVVYLASRRGKR